MTDSFLSNQLVKKNFLEVAAAAATRTCKISIKLGSIAVSFNLPFEALIFWQNITNYPKMHVCYALSINYSPCVDSWGFHNTTLKRHQFTRCLFQLSAKLRGSYKK